MLSTDPGSVYDADARVLGSIGTGTIGETEENKILMVENDERFLHLPETEGAVRNGLNPLRAGLQP